jgi:hypothetical protein
MRRSVSYWQVQQVPLRAKTPLMDFLPRHFRQGLTFRRILILQLPALGPATSLAGG